MQMETIIVIIISDEDFEIKLAGLVGIQPWRCLQVMKQETIIIIIPVFDTEPSSYREVKIHLFFTVAVDKQ
jgi:hypothetical protein